MNLDNINFHDSVLKKISIKKIKQDGSTVKIFLDVYLHKQSSKRTPIKIIFKKVEKLYTIYDFPEIHKNKFAGNIDIIYNNNIGYTIMLFGGLIHISTDVKPLIAKSTIKNRNKWEFYFFYDKIPLGFNMSNELKEMISFLDYPKQFQKKDNSVEKTTDYEVLELLLNILTKSEYVGPKLCNRKCKHLSLHSWDF